MRLSSRPFVRTSRVAAPLKPSTLRRSQQACLVMAMLAVSALAAACGTSASDKEVALDETPLAPPAEATTVTTTVTTTTKSAVPGPVAARTAPARTAEPRMSAPVSVPVAARPVDAVRQISVPSGTTLHLRLNSAVSSDASRVEDAVSAELMSDVIVAGRTALPAGALVEGAVIGAEDSGRVKGRASLALDFTSLTAGSIRYAISATPVSRLAAATKSEDATKIGVGAGAGAIIGGILGGKKGAAQGAVVGGGAGTGVVLATKGKEVRLAAGSDVSTELAAPLVVRIPN